MTIKSELIKMWHLATSPSFRAGRIPRRAYRRERGKGTPAKFTHLKAGDIVLDIGGFVGDWSEEMTRRYGVKSHSFEPHPDFINMLKERFDGREDVDVHGFAIGSENGTLSLSDQGNASSALVGDGPSVQGTVRDVASVFEELKLDAVAVAKINIEGGEYDLVPALIDTKLIERVDRLVIQFHKFAEGDVVRRDAIREDLARTHVCEWVYPFVWEQWARKA